MDLTRGVSLLAKVFKKYKQIFHRFLDFLLAN